MRPFALRVESTLCVWCVRANRAVACTADNDGSRDNRYIPMGTERVGAGQNEQAISRVLSTRQWNVDAGYHRYPCRIKILFTAHANAVLFTTAMAKTGKQKD